MRRAKMKKMIEITRNCECGGEHTLTIKSGDFISYNNNKEFGTRVSEASRCDNCYDLFNGGWNQVWLTDDEIDKFFDDDD